MFSGVAKMMVVVLGLLPTGTAQRTDPGQFSGADSELNCVTGLAHACVSLPDALPLSARSSLRRLLMSKCPNPAECSSSFRGLAGMSCSGLARFAAVLKTVCRRAVLPELRNRFELVAVAASLRYDGFSHDVNLLDRFAGGQGHAGVTILRGPISL